MAIKGLLFEWFVYHEAVRNYGAIPSDDKDFKKSKEYWDSHNKNNADVVKAARDGLKKIAGRSKISSVEKMSGGQEPKTDLVIKVSSKEYRLSLKFGESFQLSSAGIINTSNFFERAFNGYMQETGNDMEKTLMILEALDKLQNEIGETKSIPQAKAKQILSRNKEVELLLKAALGSGKEPQVSKEYEGIKKAIIKEALTGNYSFQNQPMAKPNYILSEKGLIKIDDKYLTSLMDKTSARIRLKGRGKDMRGRLNEIVVSIDVK